MTFKSQALLELKIRVTFMVARIFLFQLYIDFSLELLLELRGLMPIDFVYVQQEL